MLKIDPNKYTVCTMTINSDNEKKVFENHIKNYPQKFNPIVELTKFGDDDWFKKACESIADASDGLNRSVDM